MKSKNKKESNIEVREVLKTYCNEEIGTILYNDKLLGIERVDSLGNILSLFNNNHEINDNLIKTLDNAKKNQLISGYIKIDKFNYDDEYLKFINSLEKRNAKNGFYLTDGINDIGYVKTSGNVSFSKDLRLIPELSIITKDIITPVLCYRNKIVRALDFFEANFINSLKTGNNVLLLGADLGYFSYINKNSNKTIYIYDLNDYLLNYLEENVYKQINGDSNIICLKTQEEVNNIIHKVDDIIMSPITLFESQYRLFYDFCLYNYLDKLHSLELNTIINKYKQDLRDLIYTEKDEFIKVALESFNNFKDIETLLTPIQIDFAEKAEKYLEKNNIYFDNYKNFQKFIKDDNIIIKILKEE